MKLHKLISTLFCSLILLASCEDYDFKTDDSYNKLFRTPKVTIEDLDATYIDLSWSKVPSADYYILELSKDELEFTTELQTFGADKSIKTSAYKIENLLGATQYSVRIKAVSDKGIPESEYAAVTFKTKAEQILNEVSAITGTNAVISWNPAATFDRILITTGTGDNPTVVVDRAPTTEELAAGQIKLTDLTPATNYTVSVTLNGLPKGQRNFSTTENFPEGYTVVNYEAGNDINELLAAQSGDVVLVIPHSTEITFTETVIIPENINSIVFWGASGGTEKAVITSKPFTPVGTKNIIRFYNLNVNSKVDGSSQYFFNIQKTETMATDISTDINELSIEDCDINQAATVVRAKGGVNVRIGKVLINRCTINGTTKSIIDIKESSDSSSKNPIAQVSEVYLTNSTVINIPDRVYYVNNCTTSFTINHCNFFKFSGTRSILEMLSKDRAGITSLSIKNSIFALDNKFLDDGTKRKAHNGNAGVVDFTVENNFRTTDIEFNSHMDPITNVGKSSTDFFEDPDNGIFRIKDPNFTATAGDPRWTE